MKDKHLKRVDIIFKPHSVKYEVLDNTLKRSNEDVLNEVIESGLKGRGGAGFPTGLKWKFAAEQKAEKKFVICNADEGEPGTFKDREILTKVPRKVFGGMTVCAKIIGAKRGFVYLRGEYKYLLPFLNQELEKFNNHLKEINFDFKIDIFLGSGAYVCGEESALMNSMEGKRGEPRNKPPFPTVAGLDGFPTVINNVETLVYSLMICRIGSKAFKELGTRDSRGSKVFSVSGDTPIPGIYELEYGLSVKDFVEEFGDGDTKAIQIGGAAGFCVPRKKFGQTTVGYQGGLNGDSLPTGGSMMIFNSSRSMYNVLHNYLDFFEEESCGQCTPCRVGCQQLRKGIEAVKNGEKPEEYLNQLVKLTETMKLTSKCGLGQSVANSFASIVENFREEMIY
ncbi:MAG: NADH-quinone oxidoreductase subunit E [Chlorobi bacterium]|nr:NADH-quinone oxidoreductase subunit E [Chlorobiota bacterium]